MKKINDKTNLIQNAESLEAVHTCSFIGKFYAIFAFINNIKKTGNSRDEVNPKC